MNATGMGKCLHMVQLNLFPETKIYPLNITAVQQKLSKYGTCILSTWVKFYGTI